MRNKYLGCSEDKREAYIAAEFRAYWHAGTIRGWTKMRRLERGSQVQKRGWDLAECTGLEVTVATQSGVPRPYLVRTANLLPTSLYCGATDSGLVPTVSSWRSLFSIFPQRLTLCSYLKAVLLGKKKPFLVIIKGHMLRSQWIWMFCSLLIPLCCFLFYKCILHFLLEAKTPKEVLICPKIALY